MDEPGRVYTIPVLRFAFIFFLLFSSLLRGETGIVLMDGRPLSNVIVSILGQAGTARTDNQGRVEWGSLPPLPFEVQVILQDGRYLAPVLIEKIEENLTVRIEVSFLISHQVTVASTVTPNILTTDVNGKTVLTSVHLEDTQPDRLVEALADIPGVASVSEGQTAVPSIRGLARGRTLVLIDNGRVTTERRVGPSATFIDPFMLGSIEVSRGPGSVAYGSDALGGVIHIRTKRPRLAVPLRGRFVGGLGAGSTLRRGGIEVSQGFREWGFLVQGSAREFSDYQSPLGKITNSGAKDRHFRMGTVHLVGKNILSLGWQTDLGSDIGRPRRDSHLRRFSNPLEESNRFSASLDLQSPSELTSLKVGFFVGNYRLVTRRETLPTKDIKRAVSDSDVQANDFGVRLSASSALSKAQFDFGVDINGRFGLKAFGSEDHFDEQDLLLDHITSTSIENASRIDMALFSSIETELNRYLTLSGGGRLDQILTQNVGGNFGNIQTNDVAFSGYGAATIDLQQLSLSGQVSRGFRDGALSDRYFEGLTGRGLITGNPLLAPEKSFQLDLSARYSLTRGQVEVFLYRYRISDLIERFEASPDRYFFRNRGEALLRGVELDAGLRFSHNWSIAGGAQWIRGTIDNLHPMLDIPAFGGTLLLTRRIGTRGQVQLRSRFWGRDERPGSSEIVVPGYATLSLLGRLKLKSDVSVLVQLRNLLDKDYPSSPDRHATLAPGRSGSVTLLFGF